MKISILLLLLLAVTSISNAQHIVPQPIKTGTNYLNNCKYMDNQGDPRYNEVIFACLAWSDGFWTGVYVADLSRQQEENAKPAYCKTDNMTTGQVIRVILKYIKDHPEDENLPAGLLAHRALTQAFGCKDLK